MNNNRTNKALPRECYTVLADQSLVVITQGVQGYRRSPLDTGNFQTNRMVADAQNSKLGVTREQASAMFKTAMLIGCNTRCQTLQHSVFEAYIYCPNSPDDTSGVSIKLPATPYEVLDGLEKAHLTDGTPYIEITSCRLDCLSEMLSPTANLHELNHLAERLSAMSEWELDCFEGMVIMETASTTNSPIPLDRLINFTHSTDNCQIAYEVYDDKSLGEFYVDNDFPVIPENLPEVLYELLDYEAIGRKARTGEGGVFTERGYVVRSGEIAEVYQSGDAVPTAFIAGGKPNYTIMPVRKGNFNDHEYDNAFSEFPILPADDGNLDRAIAQVEAASIEECSVRAVDCIVPRLSAVISDALYAAEGDCYGAVNELSVQLQRLEQSGKLYTYKAMVEAAPQDITLEEAIDLSQQVDWFSVTKEADSPAAYAKNMLSKYCIEQADELFASTNLQRYGEKLIAAKGISMTGYGALWSLDGQTVEQRLCRTGQGMAMEMK